MPVACGGTKDTLTLLPTETTVEVRLYADWTMVEAYFQKGRVAITEVLAMDDTTGLALSSDAPVDASATAYPIESIWTTPDAVRKQKRVYG